MATLEDVGRLAGVGRGTVSRVLNNNGYVKPETKERVLKAMEELHYYPNEIARQFKLSRTNLIALMLPSINHPFFSVLSECMEEELYQRGFRMIVVSSQGRFEKELEILEMTKLKKVDGIIFVTHQIHDKIDETLPLITIDRHLGEHIPYVASNNYEASVQAVQHLIDRGCRRIGYLGGKTPVLSEVEKRYQAYCDMMKKHGMEEISYYDVFNHGEELEIARAFLKANDTLDGIFCSSDILANSVYDIAGVIGKKVPEELKIVGFDGVLGTWNLHPKLTTVVQDVNEISRKVVEILFQVMKGEPFCMETFVPAKLSIGETT